MTDTSSLLSQRLKARRKECDFTLLQVSEQTGLSVSFLSDLETGRSSPSLETLGKLAACYETGVAALLIEAEAGEYARQVRIRLLEGMKRELEAELAALRAGAG